MKIRLNQTAILHQLFLIIIYDQIKTLIKYNFSIPKKVINLYIFNTRNSQLRNLNIDFTLGKHYLFGSVKLTKNADLQSFSLYFEAF